MRRVSGAFLAALMAACQATAPPRPAPSGPTKAQADERRQELLSQLGGMNALNGLLRADAHGGSLLAGRALEAYARGDETEAARLAVESFKADPTNRDRRRMVSVLKAAATPPAPVPARAPAPSPDQARRDQRRLQLLTDVGGMSTLNGILHADAHGGALLAGQALEAYARGEEAEAARLAEEAVQADPSNRARRRLLSALKPAGRSDSAAPPASDVTPPPPPAPPPEPPSAAALAAHQRRDERRQLLLAKLGGAEALNDLLRADDLDGSLTAGQALEAYANGEEQHALLLAQAALGADPGNGARRRMLKLFVEETGIPSDPDAILPLSALVQHELAQAEQAFFDRRFGGAVQACRRALLLAPDNAVAWTRLGSSFYALGDQIHARSAWRRAAELEPGDTTLARFLREHGLEK